MNLALKVYRLVAGYGHCCPPNHWWPCRVAGVLHWSDDCYERKSSAEGQRRDGPRCGGFDG